MITGLTNGNTYYIQNDSDQTLSSIVLAQGSAAPTVSSDSLRASTHLPFRWYAIKKLAENDHWAWTSNGPGNLVILDQGETPT